VHVDQTYDVVAAVREGVADAGRDEHERPRSSDDVVATLE
jgi:hypothetical protein